MIIIVVDDITGCGGIVVALKWVLVMLSKEHVNRY
jgi:hypothetical protein